MNRKKELTAIYFFLLLCLNNIANGQSGLKGKVSSTENKAVPYVSAILLQDSLFLTGTTADETGVFNLQYNFEQNKKYRLTFSSLGFQSLSIFFTYPDTSVISNVVLEKDKSTLAGITVNAKKPLITRKADRYIVNVENSFLATGNTALQVLQKSPGIWVDNDGAIKIKGNQSVSVMINDVLQRMTEQELSDYLKTLRSEDISKIEIIHNPPSEFEASGTGGIIHIILKKQRKDGLNGSFNSQYTQQGTRPYFNTGISLDYKVKKYYFFGNYSVAKNLSNFYSTTGVIYPDKSLYKTYTNIGENITRQQYRLGAAYDIAKNQTIGIQAVGAINNFIQPFLTQINYQSATQAVTGIANSERLRKVNLNSATVNYTLKTDTLGSSLKIIGDFTYSKKSDNNNFSAVYSDANQNSVYQNSTPNKTTNYSLQADYTKMISQKTEWKSGFKFATTTRDNDVRISNFVNNNRIPDINRSNHFVYDESLVMFYTSIAKTIKKTSIKAGLRSEQTKSKGNSLTSNQRFTKSYRGLFPSIFIEHTLNEEKGNSYYLNYSRRLRRPGFNELNPYRLKIDNYNIQIGNPDLMPEYSNNFEIGYVFHNDYSADIYFTRSKNNITQLANPVGNNIIEYQYKNFNSSTSYGLDINVPAKIAKWWTANNSFSVFHSGYSIGDFNIIQNSFRVRSVQTVILKNIMDIDFTADYRSRNVYANSKIPYMSSCDLGFSKRILKSKGRLRMQLTDIFNTLRDNAVTDYNNTHIEFYQKRPTRTIGLAFSYNFSAGKKFSSKRLEQSNNDERNRIGN